MRKFFRRLHHLVAPIMLESTVLPPVIALLLMSILPAPSGLHLAAEFRPPTGQFLIGIPFRLSNVNVSLIVRVIVISSVVALPLMDVLPPPRHLDLTAVSAEPALHQFLRVTIIVLDVQVLQLIVKSLQFIHFILVDAKLLVDELPPDWESHVASGNVVLAILEGSLVDVEVSWQMIVFQVRTKLTSCLVD